MCVCYLMTLENVNAKIAVLNALCDARNEDRIPIIYNFNHKLNMFEIKCINKEDNERFSNITALALDYPNLMERARKGYKTIVTKNMKHLFYPWEVKI